MEKLKLINGKNLEGFALKHPQGFHPLTHLKPHIYAVLIKVFGLAFFKKQVGLGNAQGF
ncbi:hypothetical protein SDC9_130278 [bioreactor metagenome]|uniref:Uncharacterized protein n=1 Tax=bioreactor metagenome TaxID=1076179 RepID=A0A645D215_9ZZZZ